VSLDILILIFTIILMLLLHFMIKRTKIGKAMRATADDFETAEVVGIKVNWVVSAAFMIGSSMAAIGGILYVLRRLVINPTLGILPGIKGFTAAVVGGIGHIHGAMAGGLLIGLAENIGITFIPPAYQDAIAFSILILFLLFKPSGIFGKEHETEVRKK
jgi:branched-chain amino acid transport system permease protein